MSDEGVPTSQHLGNTGIEGILALQLRNGELLIDPCLPKPWGWAEAQIRGPAGALAIQIEDPEHVGHGSIEMTVDGVPVTGATVAFPIDRSVRRIGVRLGRLPALQAERATPPLARELVQVRP